MTADERVKWLKDAGRVSAPAKAVMVQTDPCPCGRVLSDHEWATLAEYPLRVRFCEEPAALEKARPLQGYDFALFAVLSREDSK